MSSLVTVSTNAKNVYKELKNDKKHRYVIYRITENLEIDVESIGDRNLTYNDVLNELTKLNNNFRYIVVDFPVEGSVDRLILLSWCPSAGKLQQRMLYNSSIAVLNEAFVGIHMRIEAVDFDEASSASIEEKEIDVESIGERNLTYNDVLNELMKLNNNFRYIVVDFPVECIDTLILLSWCPDVAEVNQKMFYSCNYDVLKRALVGIHNYIQARDLDEACSEAVEEEVRVKSGNLTLHTRQLICFS